MIAAKFPSECHDCGKPYQLGDRVLWQPGTTWAFGQACGCAKRRLETIEAARLEQIGAEMDELANETMHAM
jgi:hypothetical protein